MRCVYIYTYTHICICIYTHIYTYMCTYMYKNMLGVIGSIMFKMDYTVVKGQSISGLMCTGGYTNTQHTSCNRFHWKCYTTQNPPNRETQIPQHTFKLKQNLNFLNLYRDKPRNPSFSIWWLVGCRTFSGNCHTPTYHSLSTPTHLTPTYGTHDILHQHVWHQLMAHSAFYVCIYIYICGILHRHIWHQYMAHAVNYIYIYICICHHPHQHIW